MGLGYCRTRLVAYAGRCPGYPGCFVAYVGHCPDYPVENVDRYLGCPIARLHHCPGCPARVARHCQRYRRDRGFCRCLRYSVTTIGHYCPQRHQRRFGRFRPNRGCHCHKCHWISTVYWTLVCWLSTQASMLPSWVRRWVYNTYNSIIIN